MSTYRNTPLVSTIALVLAVTSTARGRAATDPTADRGTAEARSAIYPANPARTTPRIELFGGYSYLFPNATAMGLLPGGTLPVGSCLCAIDKGAGASVSVPFNRWFGMAVDASGHWGGKSGTPAQRAGNADAYNISAGPQFKLRTRHFTPFAEALFGVDRLAPSEFHQDTAFGIIAGGGLDVPLTRHISARVVQADFVYSNHRFGPSTTVPETSLHGLRLQAGVDFAFGGKGPRMMPAPVPAPIAAPAPVQPAIVAAPVDVVTLTAAASPAQINAGENSTITANGVSALGRPLTYSYATSAGNIAGNGATALLATAGLGAGAAIVTVNVANDLGQAATQTVNINMVVPAVAAPATNTLGGVGFARDVRRPARVDNEAKALLDQAALNLQRAADSTLALIGYAAASEVHGADLAAQRAVNVKAYLVDEKGIDPARIALYTGQKDTKEVVIIVIPSGASLDLTGATVDTANLQRVDEDRTHPQPRHR